MTSVPRPLNLPFELPDREAVSRIRGKPGHLQSRHGAAKQSLTGFESQFTDIVDYIVKITDEIWRDRDVGRVYDTYAEDCVIYSGLGTTRGVEEVVAGTIMGINAAPDGETSHLNVAWNGDDKSGFYTSHLGFGCSTNVGETMFGPPSGKRIERFFIADCISKDNKIHTEWLMRDNGAMVRQMGLDMQEVAQQLAALPASGDAPWKPERAPRGARRRYSGDTDTPFHWAEHHFQDIWNMRLLSHVGQHYAPRAEAHWCGGFSASGVEGLQSLILSLLASLPDSYCYVDHVCWSEEDDGVIIAVRWMLEGKTKPGGLLGRVPAGKAISILGATHFRFDSGTGMIVEEWTVFDEVAALVAAYRA